MRVHRISLPIGSTQDKYLQGEIIELKPAFDSRRGKHIIYHSQPLSQDIQGIETAQIEIDIDTTRKDHTALKNAHLFLFDKNAVLLIIIEMTRIDNQG